MLKGISILASAILFVVPAVTVVYVRDLGAGPLGLGLILWAPLIIWLACLLFTVRGYAIESGELLIRRLLWSTRVPLDGLRSVEHDPSALDGSLRLLGNGGLFSFSGWFRNKRLGRYRAYLTDHRRAVILTWADRTIAISPDQPEELVKALERWSR